MRLSLLAALLRRKGGVIVHDVADELQMVKLCEGLWPGEKISKIRKQIEFERAISRAEKSGLR
jgi:hypothetical protein